MTLFEFLKNYNKTSLKSTSLKLDDFHPEVLKVVEEIEIELLNSSGPDAFIRYLDSKFEIIYLSEIETGNKEKLLKYISSYKVAIKFVDNNSDILTLKSNDSDLKSVQKWWSSWGRCAAGILGGAGTGALTFGLAGAAVGTIALPIVGTVSAGLVGAVGGAIAGGLTGAASTC